MQITHHINTDNVHDRARHTTLYYREGASDKVYHVSLEPADNGSSDPDRFVVRFAFGRRGATLQTGTRTPEPVDYPTALGIYNTLVVTKTNKGYTPGGDGVPYQHPDHEGRATGVFPQLLNPVEDEHRLAELLLDPLYGLQEKLDGRRLLLRKRGNVVEGINRRGLLVALPEPMVHAARQVGVDCLLDGEAVGEVLVPAPHAVQQDAVEFQQQVEVERSRFQPRLRPPQRPAVVDDFLDVEQPRLLVGRLPGVELQHVAQGGHRALNLGGKHGFLRRQRREQHLRVRHPEERAVVVGQGAVGLADQRDQRLPRDVSKRKNLGLKRLHLAVNA